LTKRRSPYFSPYLGKSSFVMLVERGSLREGAQLGQPERERARWCTQKSRNKVCVFGFELNDPIQATI
jgi:hypothetical protein